MGDCCRPGSLELDDEYRYIDDSSCAFLPSLKLFKLPRTKASLIQSRLSATSQEIANNFVPVCDDCGAKEKDSIHLNVVLLLKEISEGYENGVLRKGVVNHFHKRLVESSKKDDAFLLSLREELYQCLSSSSSSFHIASRETDDFERLRREQDKEYLQSLEVDKLTFKAKGDDDDLKEKMKEASIRLLREECENILEESSNSKRVRVRVQSQFFSSKHFDFYLSPITSLKSLLLLIKLSILDDEQSFYTFTLEELFFRVYTTFPKSIIAEVARGKFVGKDELADDMTLEKVGLGQGGAIVVEQFS
jgi:hypothetical protein